MLNLILRGLLFLNHRAYKVHRGLICCYPDEYQDPIKIPSCCHEGIFETCIVIDIEILMS
jgi:hypothetical protein